MATTNRKKTTTRKSSKAAYERKKKDYELKREVILITLFCFCIFLFLCYLNLIGNVGNKISSVMFGLMGVVAYVFPFSLFFITVYKSAYPGNKIATRKTIFSIIALWDLGIVFDVINGASSQLSDEISIGYTYKFCSEYKKGGGVFSGLIAQLLTQNVGKVGTVVIFVLLLLICLVVLTEKTFINEIKGKANVLLEKKEENRQFRKEYNAFVEKNRAMHVEEQAKQEKLRKKERESRLLDKENKFLSKEQERLLKEEKKRISREAKENEKILRKDKKSQGVNFNALDLTGSNTVSTSSNKSFEDIHEINVNNFDPSGLDEFDNIPINGVVSKAPLEDEELILVEDTKVIEKIDEPLIFGTKNVQTENVVASNTSDIKPVRSKAERKTASNIEVKSLENTSLNINNKDSHEYVFPPIDLLKKGNLNGGKDSEESIKYTAKKLIETFEIFGVNVNLTNISQGPAVTRFELEPERGVKVSRIKGLVDDIKLSLATSEIRIEAPIPGKSAVGIEIPNKINQAVLFRDLIDTPDFKNAKSNLTFAIGKDIAGKVIVYDIDKFPHLLIAGATGSGKSVCINTLIMSIIYKANPDDVKLIMIDPKVVELSVYNNIPHLLIPVVTDAKKASAALNWAVAEMMERYKKFADQNVRDLAGYNEAVKELDSEMYKKLPQIVIIVDELADLMMVAKNEVEESICRLAQLARACGIHLVIATQRPSVDVITGLIKANMPSRIAFAVSSMVDSRTILDMGGAEELLGKGDMLFFPKGLKKPERMQGGFVSDQEVNKVVKFLTDNSPKTDTSELNEKISSMVSSGNSGTSGATSDSEGAGDFDELLVEAGRFIIEKDKASIGLLQRAFRIGFNRAARIMDKLAEYGVVSEDEGTKARRVLMTMVEFENLVEEQGL